MDKTEYEKTLKLTEIRGLKNLSQAYIAKKMGISPTNYGLKEKNKYEFTVKELEVLCEIFDKNLEDMVKIIRN